MASTVLSRPLRPGARSLAFLGVFVAALLGFLSLGAVLPVLPRYVRGPLGAGDLVVGIAVGIFALTAVVGRPLAGRAADARGRRSVVVAGLALLAVSGALYFVPAGVPGVLLARLVTGAGEALVFTAGATWAVDLAPRERRGQVIGLFGMAVWGGLSLGPLAGEGLLAAGGYPAVWAFAATSPLLGALLARRLEDRHEAAELAAPQAMMPRRTVRLGVALALANVGYAVMAAFVVLHLSRRGIDHGATVFIAFAASVVATRLVAGSLPDRLGGRRTALGAFVAEALGLALVALAPSLLVAVAGGVTIGAGFSVLFPSLALLVVDDAQDDGRGGALGAFTAFFDAGVGLGAPFAGAIASLAGYPAAFWAAAGCAGVGLALVLRDRGPASAEPLSAEAGRAASARAAGVARPDSGRGR